MRFCSNCGEVVQLKIPKMDDRYRYCCPSCGMIHYQNPKMVVGVLPIYNDEILLCQRAINPQKGLWTVPSGFMENGETLEAGALREAREEAGIAPELGRLHTIYSLPHINQVYFLFLGHMPSKAAEKGIETSDLSWTKVSDIPWQDLAFSSVQFALEAYKSDLETGNTAIHSGVYEVL